MCIAGEVWDYYLVVATETSTDDGLLTMTAGSPAAALASIDTARVRQAYRDAGAILFRGYHTDTAAFRAFAEQFCSGAILNDVSGRELVDEANRIQSVNVGADPFPLHPELSVVPWRPDVCFFACLRPPTRGGETLVCDGTAIVDAMPAEIRAAFAPRRLRYARAAPPRLVEYWLGTTEPDDERLRHVPPGCPFRFERSPEGLVQWFTAPALHRPMFTDRRAFGNFLLFARDMLRLTDFPTFENGEVVPDSLVDAVRDIGESLAVTVRWQPGDVLMLDNTRFMHGRRAILDRDERLIVSYFGYLDFAVPGPEEPANAAWRQPGFTGFYSA